MPRKEFTKKTKPYTKPATWNDDMTAAPKGKWINETRKGRNGKETTVKAFHRDVVWAKGKCGTITLPYWVPDEKRWCMFVKDVPPIAWAEFTGERVK